MSPLRVIGDQVSKQHFGKQSLIGYRSNVGGRFIGTSMNISVSFWQDHTLGNCSRSLAINSLTLLIPSLLVPKILYFFLTSEHKLFFLGLYL